MRSLDPRFVSHIRRRRRALRRDFDVSRQFEALEESCVPSYVHGNRLAAWVAWSRLVRAHQLYTKWAPRGEVLDFGAATGELGHLLESNVSYGFIEQDELLASALAKGLPRAHRTTIDTLDAGRYSAVFALDSLEHNHEVGALLDRLIPALKSDGVLILSGPTESLLYRIGRKVAGFEGHYHVQTIWDIEREVKARLALNERVTVLRWAPLFSVTAWRR